MKKNVAVVNGSFENVINMLGQQVYTSVIGSEELKNIKAIITNNVYAGMADDRIAVISDPAMCGADLFMYGYIMGKKAERERRKE